MPQPDSTHEQIVVAIDAARAALRQTHGGVFANMIDLHRPCTEGIDHCPCDTGRAFRALGELRVPDTRDLGAPGSINARAFASAKLIEEADGDAEAHIRALTAIVLLLGELTEQTARVADSLPTTWPGTGG